MDELRELNQDPEALIPGPSVIKSEDFADIIVASLKQEGIDFVRAMRILNSVGNYCIMEPDQRREVLDRALGTWKNREVVG